MSEKAGIPTEKGKFCLKIKKQMKLENNVQVANVLKINSVDVCNWIDDFNFRKSLPVRKEVRGRSKAALLITTRTITDTKGLDDKERSR